MATNTKSNTDEREQLNYRPGESYEPWDENHGGLIKHDDNPDYGSDSGYGGRDNGDGYNTKGSLAQDRALDSLRGAENSALSGKEPDYRGQNSLYTGKGKGQSSTSPIKNGVKGRGKKRRGLGAVITIALIIVCGGAFLGASNSLLAPALSALITSSTQTSFTSYTLRTRFLTSNMMKGVGNVVKKDWSGSLKYANIPDRMRTRFAKFGIEVTGTGAGTKMSWTHTLPNGTQEVIPDIDADKYVRMYNENPAFRESATRAKRGRVANFFDTAADKLFKKLGTIRNWFANFVASSNADTDKSNYNSTLQSKFENDTIRLSTNTESTEEWTDDEGNVHQRVDESGDRAEIKPGSEADADTATATARNTILGFANTVASVASMSCALQQIGGMIAITIAASENYQAINFFMGLMENVSKMMAGLGSYSAINTVLNFFATPQLSTVNAYSSIIVNFLTKSAPSDVPLESSTKAPTEAPGVRKMLNSNASASKEETKNYSLERIIIAMGGAAMFGAGATGACVGTRAFSSVISIATTISGGVATFVASFALQLAVNVAVQAVAMTFFSFLIPALKDVIVSPLSSFVGLLGGNKTGQGAASVGFRDCGTNSGCGLGDEATIEAYIQAEREVIAMEAELDRNRLSPFDTSSRHTFFGSIAYSLLPVVSTSGSMGNLSSFLNTVSKSFATLTGRVSADGEGSEYINTYGDCPLLDEIGAKGDLYCNAIRIGDTTYDMLNLSPEDDSYIDTLMPENLESCDDNGNCKVVKNSDLDKYIIACINRDSPFGVIDQNILSKLEGGLSSLSGLSAIPLVGDLIDLASSLKDSTNLLWANGQRCVNSDENRSFWNNKGRYFQRYVEDQRILEQMGAYEGSVNPVLSRIEELEAEDPLDTSSVVAVLSRISGITPENMETVLAVVEYYDFVNNYDPSMRIAMTGNTSEIFSSDVVVAIITQRKFYFDDTEMVNNPIETRVIALEHIIYADIRNRSYTV